jgi:hypothetical protein
MERMMALTNETSADEIDAPVGGSAVANNKAKVGRKGKAVENRPTDTAGASKKLAAAGKISTSRTKPAIKPAETKVAIVLKKLNAPKGTTIETLIEATNWQAHSVRGFLSAVVKKKLGHNLVNEVGKDGQRRYRIDGIGKTVK